MSTGPIRATNNLVARDPKTLPSPDPQQIGRGQGTVFTRRWVADSLLDLTGYAPDRDLSSVKLVEPAAGAGAFLLPAVERLLDSARKHGRSWADLEGSIQAWELQPHHTADCRDQLLGLLLHHGVPQATAQTLCRSWMVQGDFLLLGDLFDQSVEDTDADVVVGNPPYIRTEDLDPRSMERYRSTWRTMEGRADIYIGFFERSLRMLNPGGTVGFICSDRWMRNQYGAALRKLVARQFAVEAVWTMHDVQAFESQVSAYPAITLLRRGKQGPAVVAEATKPFDRQAAAGLIAWSANEPSGTEYSAPGVRAHRLPHWFAAGESWPTGSPDRLRLIEHLNDNFPPLQDPATGTRVGIGVASGADKVFVTTDSTVVEEDRLLPLSMVRDLSSGEFRWSGHYLVNPWGRNGNLVNLDDFPELGRYLSTTGAAIRRRYVARKSPHQWYRTIDRVDHDLISKPKLLLQDMKTSIHPVLEPGGWYPHHNLYYVVSNSWDLEVLGGLLLSRIAQAFIEAYCVRMRGDTLRFQTQYLKKIRVPHLTDLDPQIAEGLQQAFRARDTDLATHFASLAYGLTTKDITVDWN